MRNIDYLCSALQLRHHHDIAKRIQNEPFTLCSVCIAPIINNEQNFELVVLSGSSYIQQFLSSSAYSCRMSSDGNDRPPVKLEIHLVHVAGNASQFLTVTKWDR